MQIARGNLGQPSRLDLPPVSILKPLKGNEPGMEESLRSFFALDYPEYEILFSVADPKDPARAVAARLIQENLHVRARLIVGGVEIGPNPKVNNLYYSYHEAAHDCLLISDSNVRVEPGYLRIAVSCLGSEVGVVTAAVAGRSAEGLGGLLEAVYLNTFCARGMEIARALRKPFVIGKSMLFRRSVAERFGGIRALGSYIAEDYMAGEAMRRLGLEVAVMPEPVPQHIGEYSLDSFWSRHLRWGRIRKAQAPLAFCTEPFFGALVSGVLGAVGFGHWIGLSPSLFLALHFSAWLFCDWRMIRLLGKKAGIRELGAWALREVIAFPLWVHAASGNGIHWRGNRLRILPGGLVATV